MKPARGVSTKPRRNQIQNALLGFSSLLREIIIAIIKAIETYNKRSLKESTRTVPMKVFVQPENRNTAKKEKRKQNTFFITF
jgi:hypothetical protein